MSDHATNQFMPCDGEIPVEAASCDASNGGSLGAKCPAQGASVNGDVIHHVMVLLVDNDTLEVVRWRGRIYLVATGSQVCPSPMLQYLGFTRANNAQEAIERLEAIK